MSDDPSYRAKPASAIAHAPRPGAASSFDADASPAELVRQHLQDQLAPVLELRDEIARTFRPAFDVDRARQRMAAGQQAYDPLEAIGSAGNLLVPFVRATVAVERAALAPAREMMAARDAGLELMPLIAGWLASEPVPRDRVRAAARRAAAVIANAVLRVSSAHVLGGRPAPRGARPTCPCCGCAPDFTRTTTVGVDANGSRAGGVRTLVCARCDTEWATTSTGCAGCGSSTAPSIAHVESPLLGYRLVLCNPCGRYLKEPTAPWSDDVTIERALTMQLDAAAEARGLRL
jgi:formate dehydrogenase maturation protein FdhE